MYVLKIIVGSVTKITDGGSLPDYPTRQIIVILYYITISIKFHFKHRNLYLVVISNFLVDFEIIEVHDSLD